MVSREERETAVRFWYRGGTVSRETAKVMSDFRFRWQQVL